VPELSLHTLRFQIPENHLGQWHHHCSNTTSQPSSTNYPGLTIYYLPRCCRISSPVETRMLHNPRQVLNRTFTNPFEVAKRFMEAIVFTKTLRPISSDDKYSMIEEAWKPLIEAHNHQWALTGAPVVTPSVCQLCSGQSLKINLQTREPISLGFCSTHLHLIYDIDNAPKYTLFNPKLSTI